MNPLEQFDSLMPLACLWAQEQEAIILRSGVPLTVVQMAAARDIGVQHPDRVRLLKVDRIPLPEHPKLRAATEATSLISPHTNGLALQYGIFIRSDHWDDHRLVIHELVHTKQYEQLGGMYPFLKSYLYECLTVGYPEAPMEQDAISTAASLAVAT